MNEDRVWQSYVRGLRLRGRSEETVTLYRRSYDRLRAFTKAAPFTLTRLDLEEYFEHRQSEVAGSTAHKEYRNLRVFFRWLLAEGHIAVDPMERVPEPEVKETNPRVLSDAELKALFGACRGQGFRDRRDLALLRLMSEAGGPRRAEIGSITVANVDWHASLVRLTGKTGTRLIYFGDRTGAALERYMRMRDRHRLADSEWLWLPSRGPMPANTVRNIVVRRGLQAGIGDIHPHTLRHTAAHRAMDAGMGGTDMQTLFGWKGPAMLLVYGRTLRVSRAQNAARRLSLGDRV